jgi:hypothetical protein
MNRWAVRMLGILLIMAFLFVFLQMYRTLVALQKQQAPPTATTSTQTQP